jgi:hypothetical protein
VDIRDASPRNKEYGNRTTETIEDDQARARKEEYEKKKRANERDK